VRSHERRVEVDHDLLEQLASGPGPGQLGAGELTASQPGPVPRGGPGQPDLGEHRAVDTGQDPPDRRGRRDRPGRAVQPLLISQRLDIGDGDRAVGDRDRDVN
jgi:hypothetical protein